MLEISVTSHGAHGSVVGLDRCHKLGEPLLPDTGVGVLCSFKAHTDLGLKTEHARLKTPPSSLHYSDTPSPPPAIHLPKIDFLAARYAYRLTCWLFTDEGGKACSR